MLHKRAATNAITDADLIRANSTGLITQPNIDDANTQVEIANTAATNAETAYTSASDITGEELVTLSTTAKEYYDAAHVAATTVVTQATDLNLEPTYTEDRTAIDEALLTVTGRTDAVSNAEAAVLVAQAEVDTAEGGRLLPL